MVPLLALALLGLGAETGIATTPDPESVPTRFRLEPQSFAVRATPKYTLTHSSVEVLDISYPSPVASPHPENNTVSGELFRPLHANGPTPAVVVFDIMQGNEVVSRGQALWLAMHGISAISLRMPYYGPRRPPGAPKMISPDVQRSVANVTQAVLDARRAIAFLAARPDVDPNRIGVIGTSLGSFVAGLVAAADPKVSRAALLLGGGDLVNAFYDHPKARPYTVAFEFVGGRRADLKKLIDPIDPITYAEQLKTKKLLLIAASRDDVVPPKAMTALWKATGEPTLLWVDGTHVGGALYAFPAMAKAIDHFQK